jgi:hypothetical protein
MMNAVIIILSCKVVRCCTLANAIFLLKKGSGTQRVTQNSSEVGGVSYTSARRKRSGCRPSEKELPEWRSVTKLPLALSSPNPLKPKLV